MELRLEEYGTIEITNATLVEGGDILIEAADGFRKIAETVGNQIVKAYIVEVNFIFGFVGCLDTSRLSWDDEIFVAARVENQNDVYKLKAFL